ncbi:aminotransferase class I/II-fold pyridoxal phosphate-dependent enzyme [Pseudodesulfovibrio sp. F-1]|uniref:Aminotransferase class I/II-fold pyridoxal phosphate-dependent enzyme n=1 Tax=Pseudodesulfovibrio alkaliphilus TaxID=2661613 RepID=A0A7K1KLG3_9BACT|nr:PLP-dependent aminotransferase family protein [Pseudodesulfovibrio alkaliphilus]MUM76923.1 aminotransferase class I/II-fold pyridoxal phosphate-dependent enzyme [Pseudodesulfovibrio alkaliphilus]
MADIFARRMGTVHRSFIREILKVTADPEIISFAGGLPNPELFPVAAMDKAAHEVFSTIGASALQYSTTEGDAGLRAIIARRYKENRGLDVDPDSILITTGSQQILDMVAKVFIDRGDKVVIERPGYLGAIQAFSLFEPEFVSVSLEPDGPDLAELEAAFRAGAKCFYSVPNFQNPSGVSYSLAKRQAVARLLDEYGVLFVEDDPYGELRFMGDDLPSIFSLRKNPGILCGSFSKIAAPGFRLGWLVADRAVLDKLVIAKQAADLHTSTVAQAIMRRYLETNDIEGHVALIRERYGSQREVMVEMIRRYFPPEVSIIEPEGGMFLWATMPRGASSMDLFDAAIKDKVAFVPGQPFHVDGTGDNTLRLNFSNSDAPRIEEGIRRLGRSIQTILK